MEGPAVRSFYRIVRSDPPGDRDLQTHQDRRGDPPAEFPEDVKRSWDALSVFNTLEGARRAGEQAPHLGKFIARFDIPEGVGVTLEQTGEESHYDLRGDKEILMNCLTGVVARVRRPKDQEAG